MNKGVYKRDMDTQDKKIKQSNFSKFLSYSTLSLLVLSAGFVKFGANAYALEMEASGIFMSTDDFEIDEAIRILQDKHSILSPVKSGGRIRVIGGETEGFCNYVSFDNDLGFAIFDDDNIFKYEDRGSYPSTLSDRVCYSLSDGFLYSDPEKGGLYTPFDIRNNNPYDERLVEGSQSFSTTTWSDTDGKISDNDIDAYMASEHPSWTFGWEYALQNFYHKKQDWNSQYVHKKITDNGTELSGYYTERNCVPNSISSYFYNLPTVKNSLGHCFRYNEGFLSGRATQDLSSYFGDGNDVFYPQFHDNIRDVTDYTLSQNSVTYTIDKEHWSMKSVTVSAITSVETIYWQTRNECITHGYLPDHGVQFDSYGEAIMESIALNLYGYSIDIVPTQIADSAVSNLISGIPVAINTIGSVTYGNHAMVAYGYRRYYKDANQTDAAYIWLVSDGRQDGQSTNRYWFDPSKCNHTTLFTTNRATLTWPSC